MLGATTRIGQRVSGRKLREDGRQSRAQLPVHRLADAAVSRRVKSGDRVKSLPHIVGGCDEQRVRPNATSNLNNKQRFVSPQS